MENLQRRDVHPLEEAQGSLVVLRPDNRVVELSFVSSIPFILLPDRSLSEPTLCVVSYRRGPAKPNPCELH
jgi:hypothetical protein